MDHTVFKVQCYCKKQQKKKATQHNNTNSSLCWAILGVIMDFFRGLRAGSLKSLCIRFLIVLVVTLISSCIDLFISDEEMNGCFWQSCLILQSVLGVVVRGLPLLFKGERLRFCLFLCNIRLTDASESFNRFEISTFL